ncbi:MAG: glycerol-3-phosphate dehydrogenase subunit GlpB [Actinomycetaceae bacterium]|nr:glycerol-3-phosphate dehydrogenase subunit GlpB [Actinomycetaceae bacterium]
MSKALVIGSGLAGLVAALRLDEAGHDVTVLTMGMGGLQLSQGTVDILGYSPERVANPIAALGDVDESHPYRKLGEQTVRESVTWLKTLLGEDYLVGDIEANVVLPSVVGALRPTALYQPQMAAGVLKADTDYTIVGIKQYKDFYPELIAGNLARQELPGGGKVTARAAWIDFEVRSGEADASALTLARALDRDEMIGKFAWALSKVPGEGPIGVPAILGYRRLDVAKEVSRRLGREVFEIPGLPPSIPGMRLNEALRRILLDRRIRLIQGAQAIGFTTSGGKIASVRTHAAGRDVDYAADVIVYAAGGFESGALEMTSYGEIRETLFDLPLVLPEGSPVHGDYWGDPQPLFLVGVTTDDAMRPVGTDGKPVYDNLTVAGSLLAGSTRWEEKSGEGIAIASAWVAARTVSEV